MRHARRGLAVAAAAVALAGCGETVSVVDGVPRKRSSGDAAVAADAITAFGADVYAAVARSADDDENVVVSPLSIAIALAMLEPGATGAARDELRSVLHVDDAARFHDSLNALEADLSGRQPDPAVGDADPGEVLVRVANAAYLEKAYAFKQRYLDAVSRHYGSVLHAVDFRRDAAGVVREVNRFVADVTAGRIPKLLADDALDDDTRLALVNALYLKASWREPFAPSATRDRPFTTRSGERVVPMMHGHGDSSARGDGWVAATKKYVGGLAVQFFLPDEGRFDDVAALLDAAIAEYDRRRTAGGELVVPRFEARFSTELRRAFETLGLRAPYDEGNLMGIADDRKLVLDAAAHEAFVAMDEEGMEAAAATALSVRVTSGPPSPPVRVVLDRPFLYRIFDERTGATLFVGRVVDPAPSASPR